MSPRPSPDTALRVLTELAKGGRIRRDPPIGETAERRRVTWASTATQFGEGGVHGPASDAGPLMTTAVLAPDTLPLPQYNTPPTWELRAVESAAVDSAASAPSDAAHDGHDVTHLRSLADLNERHQR